MKRVVLFFARDILPVSTGTGRAVYALAEHLNSLPDVDLTLVTIDMRGCKLDREKYKDLCSRIVVLDPPKRWGVLDILNKITARIGIPIVASWFWGIALRREFTEICVDADAVIINYGMFASLLPREIRKNKAVVVTHDIMFYRLASKYRAWVSAAVWIWFNRIVELRVLRSFLKIGVFGEYEREILERQGIGRSRIVCLGMPISVKRYGGPKVDFKYDFLLTCSAFRQNEDGVRCFFERVAPLLRNRSKVTLGVAGAICRSPVWDAVEVPANFQVERLGYVEDLAKTFAQSVVAIGTLPWGSGIKLKVVEAIFHGKPVVVTNSGIEGIPNLPIATLNVDICEPERTATILNEWLDNPEEAAARGLEQAKFLELKFSPDVALRELRKTIGV